MTRPALPSAPVPDSFRPAVGQQFSCTPQFLRLMMEFDALLCEHGPDVAAEELSDFEFWAKWLIKKARET